MTDLHAPKHIMTKKRRRGTQSFWLDDLQRSRSARRLRRSAQDNDGLTESLRTAGHTVTEESMTGRQASTQPISSRHQHLHVQDSTNNPQPVPTQDGFQHSSPTTSLVPIGPERSPGAGTDVKHGSVPGNDRETYHSIPDLFEENSGVGLATEEVGPRTLPNEESEPEIESVFQPFDANEGDIERNSSVHEDLLLPPSLTENMELLPISVSHLSDREENDHGGNVEELPLVTRDMHHMAHRQHDTDSEDATSIDIEVVQKSLRKILQIWRSPLNLAALLAVVGSVRYTARQFEYTRDMLRDVGANPTWPSYATTQGYFQRIIDSCMPRSVIAKLSKTKFLSRSTQGNEVCESEAGDELPDLRNARETGPSLPKKLATETVRIFLPSSWAKLDVATPFVFNEMFPSFPNAHRTSHPLECSAIIRHRESITDTCNHLYVNKGEHPFPCGSGSRVNVSVQNRKPNFEVAFHIDESEDVYILRANITATWCVGSEGRTSGSVETLLREDRFSQNERKVITSLCTASNPLCQEDDVPAIIPGDICTLLTSEQRDIDVFPVLVHRYWRYEENGIPSCSVIWVQVTHPNPRRENSQRRPLEVLGIHVVEGISIEGSEDTDQNRSNPDPDLSHRGGTACCGYLADGTPFVVYRILLYCDDFQQSSAMFPNGSAGGCYFLPMSLPPEARRNTSSVRIISLTPPGVSTNEVLRYIVDDIVHASVHGVKGYTPSGKEVRIFIDVVGFVGDYPASSWVIDVVGHVGRSPCTVCSFRCAQHAGTEGSRYGFTTDVHANNSAFMRHGERHMSLRASNISDHHANLLGMVSAQKYSDTSFPLLHFQREIQAKKSRSALSSEGVPVVCNSFDAFRCNVIATDHLLTGLTKDILNALFRELPTKTLRMKSDSYICSALRENGLLRQKQIFNDKKKKLHSMTLSELFSVLAVSVPIFGLMTRECPSDHITLDCYRLLKRLQHLIALTYWWPVRELDGDTAVTLVHKEKQAYLSDLKSMSKGYIRDVDEVCKKSETVKEQLDKPNLHRLIELYEHTIPSFGHVLEVMELVFESAHQPLKRCIARSNNHDAHIFAVEHCVGNDWQGRLAALVRESSHPDEARRTLSRRGLRRLMLGEQADLLDDQRHTDVVKDIDHMLHYQFTPAVMKQFVQNDMVSNFHHSKEIVWKARVRKTPKYFSTPINVEGRKAKEIFNLSKQWITALYPSDPDLEGENDEEHDGFVLFERARRVKVSECGRQIGKPSGHDTLSPNTCVQVHLDPSVKSSKLLESTANIAGARPFFYAVLAFIQRREEVPFAICFRCTKRGDFLKMEEHANERSFQLLRMSPDVRRTAIYHECDGDGEHDTTCKWDVETVKVTHTKSLLRGGFFRFQTRAHGYPPRVA